MLDQLIKVEEQWLIRDKFSRLDLCIIKSQKYMLKLHYGTLYYYIFILIFALPLENAPG